MKFYFCETCGKRLTEAELAEGEAKDKKLKGVFCKECAIGVTTMEDLPLSEEKARELLAAGKEKHDSSKRSAPGAMNFYFCEKCGERLTEKDLQAGEARDKKLKGVYCIACAEGVLTVEYSGMTTEEARRLVAQAKRRESGEEQQVDPVAAAKRRRGSSRRLEPARARRSKSGLHVSPDRPSDARLAIPSKGNQPTIIAAVVGACVLLALLLLFVIGKDSQPSAVAKQPARGKKDRTNTKNEPSTKAERPPEKVLSLRKEETVVAALKSNPEPDATPKGYKAGKEPVEKRAPPVAPQPKPEPRTPAIKESEKEDQPKEPVGITKPEPPKGPREKLADARAEVPVLNPSQQRALTTLNEVFALLKSKQADEAQTLATRNAKPDGEPFPRVLEAGQTLLKEALALLAKKPPRDPIEMKVGNSTMMGRINRIEDGKAWIKGKQGLELPMKLTALPAGVLCSALKLGMRDPADLAKRALLSLIQGDVDRALKLAARIDAKTSPDLHWLSGTHAKLNRLDAFRAALGEIEELIIGLKIQDATTRIETVRKQFKDLAEGPHKPKLDLLAEWASRKTVVNRLREAFSGEMLKAEENYYVEVRYKAGKDHSVWDDFKLGEHKKNRKGDTGLSIYGIGSTSAPATSLSRWQPEKLRIEARIRSREHDVVRCGLGKVHCNVRWSAGGRVEIHYAKAYPNRFGMGPTWDMPRSTEGSYGYVFERDRDVARIHVEGKAILRKKLDAKAVDREQPAAIYFAAFHDVVIVDLIIKGRVDPAWLDSLSKQKK